MTTVTRLDRLAPAQFMDSLGIQREYYPQLAQPFPFDCFGGRPTTPPLDAFTARRFYPDQQPLQDFLQVHHPTTSSNLLREHTRLVRAESASALDGWWTAITAKLLSEFKSFRLSDAARRKCLQYPASDRDELLEICRQPKTLLQKVNFLLVEIAFDLHLVPSAYKMTVVLKSTNCIIFEVGASGAASGAAPGTIDTIDVQTVRV